MVQPRILLLQAREDGDRVIGEERRIFARNAGVPEDHISLHSLLKSAPAFDAARSFDAVMIGGSGEYFVSRGNLPHFEQTLDFLRRVVENGPPVFASCFGFQLIVQALGGEIRYRPEAMELGTYTLALTDAGRGDPLFGRLPDQFAAHLGHKDSATRLPEGVHHLASSELSPYQAIRVDGRPVWATQFHPEVTREENLGRFKRYIELYAQTMDPEALRDTVARFQPAPDTETLIPGFMQLVFG